MKSFWKTNKSNSRSRWRLEQFIKGNQEFKEKIKPISAEKKQEKETVFNNLYKFFEARQRILDAFNKKIFLMKSEGVDFY